MDLESLGNLVEEDLMNVMLKCLELENKVDNSKFIGNHPISLTLDNIPLLLTNDYMVCEKTDGVRALLFVHFKKDQNNSSSYFYDRKNRFIEIEHKFIAEKDTILDGELFYDDNENLRFAVFDCVLYEGLLVKNKDYLKRLFYCDAFIKKQQGNPVKRLKTTVKKIDIYLKTSLKSYGFIEVYKQIESLKHENDGLIFTPVNEPYLFQKRGSILKWKPPSINTVDLKIEKIKDHDKLYALKCGYSTTTDLILDYFVPEDGDILDLSDGSIGEFKYDKTKIVLDYENLCVKQGGWVLYKMRTDKDTPNHYRVAVNIINSLDENLDIEKLSRYYKPMRNNYKLREEQLKMRKV